jgi:quercetin dioxygenase-like cupin family protein
MSNEARRVPPTRRLFVANSSVTAADASQLEGQEAPRPGLNLAIKALMATPDMLLMEVQRPRGRVDPRHVHADHDSICYLVSGKVRVVIGEEEFLAGPGDCWLHPAGVEHYHETLEDSVQIEIKSPPMRTWD